jgi:hypothetical protein
VCGVHVRVCVCVCGGVWWCGDVRCGGRCRVKCRLSEGELEGDVKRYWRRERSCVGGQQL